MPRPERALDPDAGPVQSLAAQLRELRRTAGNPGYRELAARTGYSVTTLANAAGGRQLPSLAVTLAFARACQGDPEEWQRRWQEAAAKDASQPAGTEEAPPYRGLLAYGVDDADWFFGRDRIVTQVAGMLSRQRLVAVFGASGSGKSSLLRAGLMPAMSGDERVPVLLTPGAEPLAALRQALERVPADRDGVLVVDQFEELFTLCPDPAERAEFVAEISQLVTDPATRTRVVIGVRADFYGHCAEVPALATLLAGANIPVGPLSEDELRDAITAPARRAGLSVERALVTKVLADAAGQPGALPLMSHALLETWRQRRSDVLTVGGYEAVGGLAGAIAQTAESMYQGLTATQRDTARRILTRLVTLGEGVEDTRRRANRGELAFPGADAVLPALAAARLVVLDDGMVDLAHEALIGAWPRLRGWLHADREALRRHRQLTDDSRIWDSLGRDADALYRGARLAAWDGRDTGDLNALEGAFLTASYDRAAQEAAARGRRTRLALGSLVAGVVVLGVLASLAFVQARRAHDQRELALSGQLVANARNQLQVDQEMALLLAMEAYDTKPTQQAQSVLRQAVVDSRIQAILPANQNRVLGVSYSPDGRRLATTGADGTVRVWNATGPDEWRPDPRPLAAHKGEVWSPEFSRDGHWLATGGHDGTVVVWDLATGGEPTVLRGHDGFVSNVAFSADGQRVASAGGDGTVRIWDRTGRQPPRVLRVTGEVLGVAFSGDGRHLAASGTGAIWVWDASGTGTPRTLTGHEGSIEDIAFSRDGRRLASAGSDGTVRVWTMDGSAPPLVLRGDDGVVETVAFSPDGLRVASASSGSDAVRVWNATTADDPLVLRGHQQPVWSVAFSPDGTRLASAGGDGTLRIWDPALHGEPRVLRGHEGAVWSVDVSADGNRLVSGGEDGTVRVWATAGGAPPLVLRGHEGEVLQVAFDRDGQRVASSGRDRTVRVWSVATGREIAVLRGHTGAAISVAFGPDGRHVASAGSLGDATVRIWDLDRPATPVVLKGHQDLVRYVAYSPDGRRVASTDNGGVVRIWNSDGTGSPVVLRGHPVGLVWCADFSPDGRRLASGGQDGSTRISNVEGREAPLVLRGQQGSVWSVDYSSDGEQLVSVGDLGGGLRIWHPRSGAEMVAYRGHGASVEQVKFMPDGKRLVSGHGDGTVRTWRCEACRPIDEVRALAATRVTRTLSPAERAAFMS
ncbi:helix-turn-helix domain-containing protein [Actinomycetes bacterium KLBMP 9797]